MLDGEEDEKTYVLEKKIGNSDWTILASKLRHFLRNDENARLDFSSIKKGFISRLSRRKIVAHVNGS